MTEGKFYINFNGNIFENSDPVLSSANRAFRYGDALFETIRLMHGEILYLDKHLARLESGMKYLGMNSHPDLNFHNLYLIIRHLDQVNRLNGNGRIRLEVFRNDGGFYRPLSNDSSYLIEAEPLVHKNYILNDRGLKLDVFTEAMKGHEALSNIKTSSALMYVLAHLHRAKNNLDDCIILNNSRRIAETISSNVFILKGNILRTPALSEGCVQGVMRDRILDIAREISTFEIKEEPIQVEDLLTADEVFLTDVINGIRWAGAFRQKRYYHDFSKTLMHELNSVKINKPAV